MKVLLLLVVLGLVALVLLRTRRGRWTPGDREVGRQARADKAAAEQAVITRQGGQGFGQGGVGGF